MLPARHTPANGEDPVNPGTTSSHGSHADGVSHVIGGGRFSELRFSELED